MLYNDIQHEKQHKSLIACLTFLIGFLFTFGLMIFDILPVICLDDKTAKIIDRSHFNMFKHGSVTGIFCLIAFIILAKQGYIEAKYWLIINCCLTMLGAFLAFSVKRMVKGD